MPNIEGLNSCFLWQLFMQLFLLQHIEASLGAKLPVVRTKL